MSHKKKNKAGVPDELAPGKDPSGGNNPALGPVKAEHQWSAEDFTWIKKFITWRRGRLPNNEHEVLRDGQIVGEMMTTSLASEVARAMNEAEQRKLDKEGRSDGRS